VPVKLELWPITGQLSLNPSMDADISPVILI